MKPILAQADVTPKRDFGNGLVLRIFVDEEIGAKTAAAGTVEIPSGKATPMHTRTIDELIVMLSGTGDVVTREGDTYTMNAGDCVWIPAGVEHCHSNPSNEPLVQLYVFAPQGPEKALRDLPVIG